MSVFNFTTLPYIITLKEPLNIMQITSKYSDHLHTCFSELDITLECIGSEWL